MSIQAINGRRLKHIAIAGANYVNQKRVELNSINVFPVPDGDTGTNMALTLLAAAQAADDIQEKATVSEVARSLARAAMFGAKGNSGFIVSQLFCGLADGLEGKKKASVQELSIAFNNGVLRAYQAVSNPMEGTVLTVMRETFDYGQQIAPKTTDLREWMSAILLRSRQVLSFTPEMLPVLKKQGVVDSGGQGFVYFLEGMVRNLGAEDMASPDSLPPIEIRTPVLALPGSRPDHRYCMEILVKDSKLPAVEIRQRLTPLGSSLVAVGDSGLIRIHIHVNDPDRVVKTASAWGSVEVQKVEDMEKQQKEQKMQKTKTPLLPKLRMRRPTQQGGLTTIVTDSTCDLPKEIITRYGIQVVPLDILWGDQVYRDGIDITPGEFYQRLVSDPQLPTTSQPSPQLWETTYDAASATGRVLSIHISGKLSGTVRTAESRAKSFGIEVIDSQAATMGLGFLTMLAAGMAKQGASPEEIAQTIAKWSTRVRLLFSTPTLHYLERGGRISKTKAVIGDFLKLKPILTVDDGEVKVAEKIFGSEKRVLKRMIECARRQRTKNPPGDYWFGVLHTASPQLAETIKQTLIQEFNCPPERILVSEAGPVIGTYAGPGAFGLVYWA